MSVLKVIKGAFGFCQCEGCMEKHTTKMTMLRGNGTHYHIYVCDDCAWEIQKIYSFKK